MQKVKDFKNSSPYVFVHFVFLLGVLLALWYSASYFSNTPIRFNYGVASCIDIAIFSIILGGIAAKLWAVYMWPFDGGKNIPLSLAVVNVASVLIAKYVPGKIWGIAARATLYKRFNIGYGQVLGASIFEMYGSTLFASFVGGILYLCSAIQLPVPYFSIALLAASLIAVFAIKLPSLVKSWLGGYKFWKNDFVKEVLWKHALYVVLWNWLYWLCFSMIIHTLLQDSVVGSLSDHLGLLGAYMLAVTAGFLALLVPGGLGVREGLFVYLARDLIDLPHSLQLAVLLRLWSCLFEIGYGAFGYLLFIRLKKHYA